MYTAACSRIVSMRCFNRTDATLQGEVQYCSFSTDNYPSVHGIFLRYLKLTFVKVNCIVLQALHAERVSLTDIAVLELALHMTVLCQADTAMRCAISVIEILVNCSPCWMAGVPAIPGGLCVSEPRRVADY